MAKHQVRVKKPAADLDEFARALRLIAKLDIKQAHDLAKYVDKHANIVILAGVDSHVASYIADMLRAAGAEAVQESSSIEHPMLCTPDANTIYEWGALRTIKPRRDRPARFSH